MGFGITITASVSTNTDSPTEKERSAQVGFWSPKKKIWLSFLSIGENMKTVRKTWKLSWKEAKKNLTLEGFLSLLRSNVFNASIFTVGAFAWLLSFALRGSLLSLYIGLLFVVGASIYWNLWFFSQKPEALKDQSNDAE